VKDIIFFRGGFNIISMEALFPEELAVQRRKARATRENANVPAIRPHASPRCSLGPIS